MKIRAAAGVAMLSATLEGKNGGKLSENLIRAAKYF